MSGPLETALAVAGRLVDDAIWHEGRCSWVGSVPETTGGGLAMSARSLSADLYAGTAGVGLVLAEVAAATGDAACARTALGALRHAAHDPGNAPPELAAGFHGGLPGIALALRHGGENLGSEELAEAARSLARSIVARMDWPDTHDLIGGRAGAVVALLALDGADAAGALAAKARAFGDDMIAASRARGGWTWHGEAPGGGLSPSGISHGPAGASFALRELSAAGAGAGFAVAADAALATEDAARDPGTGNWLAGRREDGGHRPGGLAQSSFMHWCHGAPGIALVRHRAWRLGAGDGPRADAAAALALTARWVRAALDAGQGDFCLCHGLAGNAEILRDAADAAGEDAPALRALAADVAAAGIDEYLARGRPWPCGDPGDEPPGLMIGLAGIARFYLRTAMPQLPSVLLPVPDGWGRIGSAAPG